MALALTLCLFATAFGLDYYFSKNTNLHYYAKQLNSRVAEQLVRIDDLLSDEAYLDRQFTGARASDSDLDRLRTLDEAPFNLTLYAGDSLVFWSNNNAFLNAQQLADIRYRLDEPARLLTLDNGRYLVRGHALATGPEGPRMAVSLIKVYHQYALNSPYLRDQFALVNNVPEEVHLSDVATEVALVADGTTYGHLRASGVFHDARQRKILLAIFLLAFLSLGITINGIAQWLVHRYRAWIGSGFLLGAVISLRLLSEYFDWTSGFSDLYVFSQVFTTPVLNGSLGDLFIDTLLLLWMMIFFNREFCMDHVRAMPRKRAMLFAVCNYFTVVFGVVVVTGVLKSLVVSSGIVFDFENVFNFNYTSILAILCIILLLFALFLFSHRMIATVRQIGLSVNDRLLAIGGALALLLPVLYQVDLLVPAYIMLLICLAYCSMFDFSLDHRATLTGVIMWITFFAMFSSGMLFKYNRHRDLNQRFAYARQLAEPSDAQAEVDLAALRTALLQAPELRALATVDSFDQAALARLTTAFQRHFADYRYLSTNYGIQSTVFGSDRAAHADYPDWQARYRASESVALAGIHLEPARNGYLLRLPLGPETTERRPLAFLAFERQQSSTSRVYTELLLQQHFKGLERLKEYDYAIYRQGQLQDQDTDVYPEWLDELSIPPAGMYKEIRLDSYKSVLAYNHPDGTVVLMGKTLGGYEQPVRLFSYMFTLLMLTFICFYCLNYFFHILPESLTKGLMLNTLRNRIQLWIIGLEMATFIAIGVITVSFFKKNSIEYHDSRLDRKISTVIEDARHAVKVLLQNNADQIDLTQLVTPFSTIHRMDVNIFDLDGRLVSSSEDDIFKKGIVAPRMDAVAFQSLARGNADQSIKDATIGELGYKAAYVPLHRSDGRLIAYLDLPYYSKLRKTNDEIREFMGNLLNAYVFLLIIAVSVAFLIAETITRPISEIGARLKELRLGRMQPLDISWNKEDEIGELIAVNNQMILTLDDNRRKLEQNKKEEAWREMASQVAHEIKNPLTPIKMNAQMLQHRYRQDPAAVEPVIDRICNSIVDQVNAISNIVEAFRSFGKMPEIQKADFEINKLVDQVFHFSTQEKTDIDRQLDLPATERFLINADRENLMRVLNNLHKNAIQALSDDRRGRIHTRLFERKGYAVIAVSDNGVGIPPDKQAKVFEPYFTTKGTGTGLGLAMSKNIVEDARGHLYFETEQDLGTTFFIELPIIGLVADEGTPGPGVRG